ncbi:hypothetical protein ACIF6L_34265 [Kitasatospora sp. NPDC086009]|uniref:hypothetical protein n=1 Tax=unclassified Kitasatospora TaxID=2633591 RepID=UPI0037C83831
MIVSVSGVVLFGILLVVLVRNGRASIGTAVVAVLFGFLLASTGLAEPIRSALDGGAQVTSSVKP